MPIFDTDGAPISYEMLGRIAPDPDSEVTVTGRLYAEIPVTGFETNAQNDDELIADLLKAYVLKDADVLDFDAEHIQ